jgi:hypothetical protein
MSYSTLQKNSQEDISATVRAYISHLKLGKTFTTKQILDKKNFSEENSDAIASILSRMSKKEEIVRITNGVYYRPKLSRFGRLPIDTKELVAGIAKKKDATIAPAGLAAVNALGLDTQLPMVKSFIISERVRAKINVKNVKFEYKESFKFFITHFDVKEEKTRNKALILWSAFSYLDKSGFKHYEHDLKCKFRTMLEPKIQIKFFKALSRSMKWVSESLDGKVVNERVS